MSPNFRRRTPGSSAALLARWRTRFWLRFAPGHLLRRGALDNATLALAGERWAEVRLRRAGWRLLARRLRSPWGELDLVFEEQGTLVVCEVKTGRVGPLFRPGLRFDTRALAARWRAARALARAGRHRVDLLEVRILDGGRLELVHLRGLRRRL